MRECPAAGRAIEAFECATGRHSTYACPDHCLFSPFSAANYEQYTAIERAVDEKFFNWAMADCTAHDSKFESELRVRMGDEAGVSGLTYLAWRYFYHQDSDGTTCIGRFARAGFPGLKGDEKLLMQGRLQIRPVVLEVHRIFDERRVEVVDLLDTARQTFMVTDRGLAAHAVRFGVYAANAFPLPHYWRVFAASTMIPDQPPFSQEHIIREVISHLGGGTEPAGMRRWLAGHFKDFEEALTAVGLARRHAMFQAMDANMGRAVYELTKPFEECRQRLVTVPQIQDDPLTPQEKDEGFIEGRVCFAGPNDPETEHLGEAATLGRILLGNTHWRLESLGTARFDRLRQRFEDLMGDSIRFAGERREDLAAQMRKAQPAYDESLVPSSLLREPQQIVTGFSRIPAEDNVPTAQIMARQRHELDLKFLDQSVPALNGQTPRQAAREPALRPSLVQLMKQRVADCDLHNLETGRNDDINWMVRELGLNEILFDPPPPRAPLKPNEEEDDDFDDEPEFLSLPSPPPLPDQPFSKDEALARFKRASSDFPQWVDAFEYLRDLGYPLFKDLRELAGDLLEDREFQLMVPVLSLVVLCFAPRGTRPPETIFEALEDEFNERFEEFGLSRPSQDDRFFEKFLAECAQTALLGIAMATLDRLMDQMPKHIRPREQAKLIYLILLRVAIDELDFAQRELQEP
jgi:hypothetical protein